MENIGNRYILDHPLKQFANGQLVRGTDLIFKRDVLLYLFKEPEESVHQEALRWLSKASRLSDERFMHIVDVGTENGTLFAVLQAETGGLLSDRLRDLEITGLRALSYVNELAKGIRETRRDRLPECAVDVENLWVDDNGRLQIMNYWTEGKYGRRGVPGLALLLYQLGAKTVVPTSSMIAYANELNRSFADLPDETRERAVALACKSYEGICPLAHFQQELEVLLGSSDERKATSHTTSLPASEMKTPSKRMRKLTERESQKAKEPKIKTDESRGLFHYSLPLRKRHLFATAGTVVLVLMLWLALRPHPNQVNVSKPQSIPTFNPTEVTANRTETSKPSASASALPTPTAGSAHTPVSGGTPPAAVGPAQAKAGMVPDLVAHSREDAEKMAIASGLRYQYFLESNPAANGLVFKQDLAPGTAVNKGDRITFWVSKGK